MRVNVHEAGSYERIKKAISEGKVIIYPTDTVYGIGGNALEKKVVEKVYEIKKRGGKKPLSVIMGNLEMIKEYCELSKEQLEVLINYLPGPYTFILRLKKRIPASETGTIGVRVPEHQLMRRISMELKVPIISTSANLSGGKDATELKELDETVAKKADLVVDGGKTKYGQGSTVVDLIEVKVLRKGAGKFEISS